MSDINMILVEHPSGDWFTLYRDGDWVYHGHMIDTVLVTDVLDSVGFDDVGWEYKELSEELAEKYDGDKLPLDYVDLGL